MRVKSPCYGCEWRNAYCHAECGPYIEWAKQDREERERINKERQKDMDFVAFKATSVAKTREIVRKLKGKKHK